MCDQTYPVLGCVGAHEVPWLGTMQVFEPHLIRSCLLAQGQCQPWTAALVCSGTSKPSTALSSEGKLCQDQAALGEFSVCPQGSVPAWSGNPGTVQHPVPSELQWELGSFEGWDLQQRCFGCLKVQGIPDSPASAKSCISSSLALVLTLITETRSHAHVCILSGPVFVQNAAISGGTDENVTHFSSFPGGDGAGAHVLSDRGEPWA